MGLLPTIHDEKTMKNLKECRMCGRCCTHLIINLRVDAIEGEFYRARGFKVNGDHAVIDIPHRCKQLIGYNTCRLHDTEDMPNVCKKYPIALKLPKELYEEGCGYK